MLNAEFRIGEIREMTAGVLNDMIISQKIALQALEACDEKSFEQALIPLKSIDERVEEIDSLILSAFVRFSPEAKDLRELVAFLKITSALQRIATNEKNYMKNMKICNPKSDDGIKLIIKESLAINRCTIQAMTFTIEMIQEVNDKDRLKDLDSKIDVEFSKTDDIYSMIEKNVLQNMHGDHEVDDEQINILKYIRKNLKIIDRLQDIASKLIFARIGGKL
ncbi:MAG: hypothetical protein IE885_04920 [Campylobacterales bacterium]|nr:hypothetical protein [Campylobacterales bacterium]